MQKLLIGTHGPQSEDGEMNQVMIHKVKMPVDQNPRDQREGGGAGRYERSEKITID